MEKRFVRLLAACVLIMVLLLPARAYAVGVSLTGGTSGLRPGSTVTLTLSVSGSNLVAVNGSFSGIQGMSLSGLTSARSGWQVSVNGNSFTVYDTTMTHPISGSAAVFTASFKVNTDAASGSTVAASVSGVTASDGDTTLSLGSASWSAAIAAPLSSNNNLSSLSCSNASLIPAFSAGTVYYSVTVPYSVKALNLNYTKADGTASVTVSGNSLVVGSNTVTITVTAQNDAKKSYYIAATRQQDPDYQPGTNALLQSLTPDVGTISPAFDPNVTEYVVYLPYETESFSLSGVAQDSKARSVTDDSAALEEGDNVLAVTCTAEDGVTVQTYTVHVYRMPLYEGELPEIVAPGAQPEPEPEPEAEPEPEPKPTLWERSLSLAQTDVLIPFVSDYTGALPLWGLSGAGLLLLVLLFYLLGTLVGKAVGRKRTLRRLQEADNAAWPDTDLPDDAPEPAAEMTPPPAPSEAKEEPPASSPVSDSPPPAAEQTAQEGPVSDMTIDDLLFDIKHM